MSTSVINDELCFYMKRCKVVILWNNPLDDFISDSNRITLYRGDGSNSTLAIYRTFLA